jgi:4-amino-4-deoxy-L-arabinose transferase-like glycosyltransferase
MVSVHHPVQTSHRGPTTAAWSAREITLSPHLALAATAILGAVFRFVLLGAHSVWFDEAFVARVAHERWLDIFGTLRQVDAHPPLYYLLMKAWLTLAGTGDAILRLPSACFSALSVVLAYMLARCVASEQVSLLAALMVSVSPVQIVSGQEARMYPLAELLALASSLALFHSVAAGTLRRWAVYAATATLLAYTHYLGFLVIAAHGLWVACFHRRYMMRWLAAGTGVALAYLPWLPSLWFQTVHGHGWAWYRDPVHAQDLGDLFGLFAFGGGLWGMGGYYGRGTLSFLGQLAVLAPFLIFLVRGAVAVAADRSRVALIVLALIVPVGSVFLFSLAEPMFYPRWFSFLTPFFAILVARGVIEAAGVFRRWRALAAAVLAMGLLLFSGPGLAQYYLDPAARPYNWRAAAALVKKYAQPGDFYLYVPVSAEISFLYYDDNARPFLTLSPIEGRAQGDHHADFTAASARGLADRYPRTWLIATEPATPAMQRRLWSDLHEVYRPLGKVGFNHVWVTLLEAQHLQHHP